MFDEASRVAGERQLALEEGPHRAITIPFGSRYGTTPVYELAYLGTLAAEAEMIYAHDNVILTIGALLGKGTIAMASGTSRKVVSVDPHDGPWMIRDGSFDRRAMMGNTEPRMRANLEHYGVLDTVEMINEFSDVAAKEWNGRKICMLMIDGDHTYEWVNHDFYAFKDHLVDNAIVCFHDYRRVDFEGVTKAVNEIIEEGHVTGVNLVGSLLHCTYLG